MIRVRGKRRRRWSRAKKTQFFSTALVGPRPIGSRVGSFERGRRYAYKSYKYVLCLVGLRGCKGTLKILEFSKISYKIDVRG